MPPRYLLSTASLYFLSLHRSLSLAQEGGFDGLELSLTPASARADPAQIHAQAKARGLSVSSVHPPTIPLPGWGRSEDTLQRLAALAQALPDCQIVVFHVPNACEEGDPAMVRFRHRLEILQQALAGSDVIVALENRNRQPGEPLGPLDHAEGLLAFSQAHDCGIVLDTAHASNSSSTLLQTCTVLRERLVNVHLSDVVPGGWWTRFSYLRSIFSHHQPPGRGTLPLRDLVASLARSDYRGLITLELSPVALRFWSLPATRRILRRSLNTCRQWWDDPGD